MSTIEITAEAPTYALSWDDMLDGHPCDSTIYYDVAAELLGDLAKMVAAGREVTIWGRDAEGDLVRQGVAA